MVGLNVCERARDTALSPRKPLVGVVDGNIGALIPGVAERFCISVKRFSGKRARAGDKHGGGNQHSVPDLGVQGHPLPVQSVGVHGCPEAQTRRGLQTDGSACLHREIQVACGSCAGKFGDSVAVDCIVIVKRISRACSRNRAKIDIVHHNRRIFCPCEEAGGILGGNIAEVGATGSQHGRSTVQMHLQSGGGRS